MKTQAQIEELLRTHLETYRVVYEGTDEWSSIRHWYIGLIDGLQIVLEHSPTLSDTYFQQAGDRTEAQVAAAKRIEKCPALHPFIDVISYDWHEVEHCWWVATAPEAEIISWAEEVKRAPTA